MTIEYEGEQYEAFLAVIARALGVAVDEVPYFLTPAQVALVIGGNQETVRRGIKEKRIVADKVNGRWYVCRDTLFPNTRDAFRSDAVSMA